MAGFIIKILWKWNTATSVAMLRGGQKIWGRVSPPPVLSLRTCVRHRDYLGGMSGNGRLALSLRCLLFFHSQRPQLGLVEQPEIANSQALAAFHGPQAIKHPLVEGFHIDMRRDIAEALGLEGPDHSDLVLDRTL